MMMLKQQKQSFRCDWNKPSSEILYDKNPQFWLPPLHQIFSLNFFTVLVDFIGIDCTLLPKGYQHTVCADASLKRYGGTYNLYYTQKCFPDSGYAIQSTCINFSLSAYFFRNNSAVVHIINKLTAKGL